MISVKGVTFSYVKGINVLENIDIQFDRRATAIIGQNGAGKTTLVKLMKGLLRPTTGAIYIEGKDIISRKASDLARTVGLVFQNPDDQIFKNNVLDEVMFGPLNLKMDRAKAKESTLNALSMVGLENQLNACPQDLSLSDRKLLCIASVLAMNTDVIIFDEPTISQDQYGKSKIKDIISALKLNGKFVMTIIHDMDFVSENFERTIVLNQGKILVDDDTRNVFSALDILKEAHVEPPHLAQLGFKMGFEKAFLTEEEFVSAF
ncbi:MAG: energy-coupling factor ABC transporter ATP-binding protein [Oscillospiraceae bacterium]|nr:energy-coupling factor ABC transporter ATP-binding protein [Oscillospiraceae bacterium]